MNAWIALWTAELHDTPHIWELIIAFMNASIGRAFLREPPYSGKQNLQSVYSVETKRERKHRLSFDDRIHTSHAYH